MLFNLSCSGQLAVTCAIYWGQISKHQHQNAFAMINILDPTVEYQVICNRFLPNRFKTVLFTESAWESHYKHYKGSLQKLKPRKTPRRLIHGLQVNHEFDLFDARLKSLQDTIDVYIVLESNYSSYGEAKPLSFFDKFKKGWLSEFQDKLVYVFLPFFPKAGETNGWYADSFLRLYLGKGGMKLIDNVR